MSVGVAIHVDDDGFVRAPAPLVYRRLTHVLAWPQWWPGVRVEQRPPELAPGAPAGAEPDEVVALELAGAPGRRVRLTARLHDWRLDAGFALDLRGDLEGRAEFWLEPGYGGTVIHHLVIATSAHPRPLEVHTDHRRALRRGLWALKDLLELEVRTGAGLLP
ncbi:MAG: hypothetical protein WD010_01255 [Nitriliruptor sp.]|uniref:hypothetical protein n=1 Tax=Nitriliruptor sp. TaxID=2448056 RepID=UPI0034A0A4B8